MQQLDSVVDTAGESKLTIGTTSTRRMNSMRVVVVTVARVMSPGSLPASPGSTRLARRITDSIFSALAGSQCFDLR